MILWIFSLQLVLWLLFKSLFSILLGLSRRKKSTNNNILDDSSNTFSNLINKLPLKFNEPNLEDTIGLYIITPTYPRPEQLPELTRLSQTLMVNSNKYFREK